MKGSKSEKSEEKGVNLSIKVPESKRRHWVVEAKKQGTSLTAVIIEALSKKFGIPE
jgi:predicted HicB family RNase H-like nuclease